MSSKKAYFVAFAIASVVFANHFCRDTPGALERELEASSLDEGQYHTLQSVFFLPNIITPFLASMLKNHEDLLVITTAMASVGAFIFAFGHLGGSVGVMFLGRFLAGSVYEVIDLIPIILLGPLFKTDWGAMVGVMNAFLRCGSILNFVIVPLVYKAAGLSTSLFVSACVGTLMVFFAVIARTTYLEIIREEPGILASTSRDNDNDNDDDDKLGNRQEQEQEEERHWFLKVMPVDKFPRYYWFYTASGFFLYGSMVPFWFLGSKFLQLKYGFDMLVADLFMLLPEGMIVVLGPLVGVWLDRMKFTTRALLTQLAVSIALLPVAYLVLISGPVMEQQATDPNQDLILVPAADGSHRWLLGDSNNTFTPMPPNYTPVVPVFNVRSSDNDSPFSNPLYAYSGMVLAGAAYAISNSLFWTLITSVCSKSHLGPQSGIIASTMNILPTALPPLIVAINAAAYRVSSGGSDTDGEEGDSVASSSRGLTVLALSGALGAICGGFAVVSWKDREGGGQSLGLKHSIGYVTCFD